MQIRELKFLLDPGGPATPIVNVDIKLSDIGALGTSANAVHSGGTLFNVGIALPKNVAGSQNYRLLISRKFHEQQLCVFYASLYAALRQLLVVKFGIIVTKFCNYSLKSYVLRKSK